MDNLKGLRNLQPGGEECYDLPGNVNPMLPNTIILLQAAERDSFINKHES